ncbi:MAG: hypothetical protein L6R39_004351 [Caloplaca ligustica]|nr:MAG: hypothetical protein L6R39_004351 [Caloplaca ligustica]
MPTTPRFIIHGGAGSISRSTLPPDLYRIYSASLLEVNRATASRLAAGASALEAATEAVAGLEDNPWFNCGKGAVFTRDGGVELEASFASRKEPEFFDGGSFVVVIYISTIVLSQCIHLPLRRGCFSSVNE